MQMHSQLASSLATKATEATAFLFVSFRLELALSDNRHLICLDTEPLPNYVIYLTLVSGLVPDFIQGHRNPVGCPRQFFDLSCYKTPPYKRTTTRRQSTL
jgi:hypothetical protein